MTISARIIEDSVSPEGKRITTFLREYPRIVHPETLRHRVVSPSVASSRAVPVMKMLRRVVDDPAEPFEWGSNKPGMQAGDELTGIRLAVVKGAWRFSKWACLGSAYVAAKAGAHKQIANRIIEPHTHTVEIVTATELDNWFDLRLHDAADPTIRELARVMLVAMQNSIPQPLEEYQWHLPLVTVAERALHHTDDLRLVSAARCARSSYLNHDQSQPVFARDIALAERLLGDKHWSPFEHQAKPDTRVIDPLAGITTTWANSHLHGNLVGWQQSRRMLELKAAA